MAEAMTAVGLWPPLWEWQGLQVPLFLSLGINYHYFDEFLVPKSPHKEAALFHPVRILE